MDDEFAYLRKAYGLTWLKRGASVTALGKPGKVTSGTHYIWVKLDGARRSRPYHPADVSPCNTQEHGNG